MTSGQDTELLGVVVKEAQGDVSMETRKADKDSSGFVHRLKERPDVILVQCHTEVLPEQAFSFTQQVCMLSVKGIETRVVLGNIDFVELELCKTVYVMHIEMFIIS